MARWPAYSMRSPPPPGRGSRGRSPSRRPRRRAPGRRSAPATTRWSSRRPARARRWRRSSGRSTGWRPHPPPAEPQRRCRVLYISPLKALAVDVERNLRAPLAGIRQAADRLGQPEPEIAPSASARATPRPTTGAVRPHPARHPDHHAGVAVPDADLPGPRGAARRRDGDRRRGARRRRHQARRPPGAVPRAARRAAGAAGPADRAVGDRPTRATRSPGSSAGGRPVTVVQPPSDKEFDLEVVVPVEDMGELGQPTGDLTGPAARRAAPRLDLAARRGARRRPHRGAPLDHRLRQLPPAGRAADRPAQRDLGRAARAATGPIPGAVHRRS